MSLEVGVFKMGEKKKKKKEKKKKKKKTNETRHKKKKKKKLPTGSDRKYESNLTPGTWGYELVRIFN
jgi:hypothetical protein